MLAPPHASRLVEEPVLDGLLAELVQLFDVLDREGQHVYDAHLFCGDDGQVFRVGTTERVASISRGVATGSQVRRLLLALGQAYEAFPAGAAWASAAPQ